MIAETGWLKAMAGEAFERDFLGPAEIIVRREGHSRVRHVFTVDGRIIARLRWRGLRRAFYEAEDMRFEINVGALDRRISIITTDGDQSSLIHRSRPNPHREQMIIEMSEGDDFCIDRSCPRALRAEASMTVHKRFYESTLLVFRFNVCRRTQTTLRIEVTPSMKWESRYLHRLIALIACRIILERRHSGSQPLRAKEKYCRFIDGRRERERCSF